MNNKQYKTVSVRGMSFKLMTYTRSLELCSRMNYETENLDFIDYYIKPGDVLFDLGACEGRFSIYAAKKNIKVIAFEPERNNFKVLQENKLLNGIGDELMEIVNLGVSSENGIATMSIGQPWEGGHQKVINNNALREDLNFDFVEDQKIEVVSLDSFVERSGFVPNYLKVDIDGSEMLFLDGASKTMQNNKLKAIIFELNIDDANFQRIVNILKNYGFKVINEFQVPKEPNLFNFIFSRF